MHSIFIVDFMRILTQKITTCTFVCQFVKHVRDIETSFSVLETLHWCADESRQKCQFIVNSKVLCLTLSNPGRLWHGNRLMARYRYILQPAQNLLLRSAWSRNRCGPPKHHLSLPETLLPKMSVCKRSVSLIWIYIYVYICQPQTNTWDAFQGCNYITQNCCFYMNFFTQ